MADISGIDYPFAFSTAGGVQVAQDARKVQNNIASILLTRRGERFMEPDFGSIVKNLVMEPADDVLEEEIKREVFKSIQIGESRVTLEEVKINIADTVVSLLIRYTITAIDQEDSLFLQFARGEI